MQISEREKDFILSVEIPPPRGTNVQKYLDYALALKEQCDYINVTDNQRAVMRMSPLAFAKMLLDNGLNPILQLCCRDRNRLALQSDLLGAAALGIENIALMTGDFTTAGDHKQAKPVFDFDSVQLIECARDLQEGKTSAKGNLDGAPSFCIGAVVNPYYHPLELQLLKMKKKIACGAQFFQTQPLFSKKKLEVFLQELKRLHINTKLILGITPLKSLKFIDFMDRYILSDPIDEELRNRIAESKDPLEESIEMTIELMLEVRSMVDGFHLMPIGLEKRAPEILDRYNQALRKSEAR